MRAVLFCLVAVDGESAVEGDLERIHRAFPPVGSTGPPLSGRVQTHHRETDAFQCSLLVWEMTASSDGSRDPPADGFDRLGRAHNPANLRIELKEGANPAQPLSRM